ncbi:uracil-DNA glycosylase [Listeria sp. PSOL-1]|uniref:uracil-DNA glycosylase n=1 Tax=Listeria sp. PSOL-1 TaxID=1844999 RepID=UPI0013D58EEA|nr:uracil-DNA glycosylase [Listeria sp. PSOL-1]
MEIPTELIEMVKKQSAHYALEGFVVGQGSDNPRVMFVGEAPGETEIHNHIPFSGRAGKELMKFFEIAGLSRGDVYITSSVRSRPYQLREKIDRKTGKSLARKYNRTPSQKEILIHAPILDYEIKKLKPRIIVTLGNIGLRRILGKRIKVSETHGQFFQHEILTLTEEATLQFGKKQYIVMPTFHPAAIFYNRQLLPLIEADFQILARWLKENKI